MTSEVEGEGRGKRRRWGRREGEGGEQLPFLLLPQVDHVCVAIVVKRETKSLDEQ